MEPTSPPKHAVNLGSKLNSKIEQDQQEIVKRTKKKLDALAENSTQRLKEGLDTTISDIEKQLKGLAKLSVRMWTISLVTSAVLTLGMLTGLGLYANWQWQQLQRLEKQQQTIKAALQKLPPTFRVIQSGGKWYLIAPQIDYSRMTDTVHGQKEDAVEIVQ